MAVDYLQKILTAKVYDVAVETPLELAPALSARLGNRVLLTRLSPLTKLVIEPDKAPSDLGFDLAEPLRALNTSSESRNRST